METNALADRSDEELIAAEAAFRLDLLREEPDRRLWVASVDSGVAPGDVDPESLGFEALDPEEPAPVGVPDPDRDLVAFVSTSVDACPAVFDRPDRLVVGDIYRENKASASGLDPEGEADT